MPLSDADMTAIGAYNQRTAANSKLATVQGVAPTAASTALQAQPSNGVPAEVGMHTPELSNEAVQDAQTQSALAVPSVRSWVASAEPAHVAAAGDSLTELADLGAKMAAFFAAPQADMVSAQRQQSSQAFQDFLSPPASYGVGILRGGKQLLNLGGSALQFINNAALGPIGTAAQTAGEHWLQAAVGPENYKAISDAMGKALLAIGSPEGPTATVLPPEPPNPNAPRLSGPPPGPLPEPEAEFTPSPYTSEALPPQGVHPPSDAMRAQAANMDVRHIAGVQEALTKAPVFARSPEVAEDFLAHNYPTATATVDADSLMTLASQGHTPFPELAGQIAQAAAEGSDIEVPLSRYLVATAGQPYADQLNSATVFRDGGTSVDQAKEAGVQPTGEGTVGPTEQSGVISSGGIGAQSVGGESFTPVEQERLAQMTRAAQVASQAALRSSFLRPLFDGETLGLPKEQFAQYSEALGKLQSNVQQAMVERATRQIIRERAPEFKAAVAEHALKARAELEDLPAVRATKALSQPGMKLDRDLVQNFYPGNAERLPASVLKAKGNHPDNAAEQMGYDSGADMVQALADLHEARTASGARTLDQYLNMQAKHAGETATRKQFGYDLSPEANYEAASELVHGPALSRFLIEELKDAAKSAGLPFDEYALDRYIEDRFNSEPVSRAVSTRTYNSRVYNLGNKVQAALQKPDIPRAFLLRQAQYIQHRLAQKSFTFAREFKRDEGELRNLAGAKQMQSVDQGFLDRIHQVLQQYGYKVPQANIAQLNSSFADWTALAQDEWLSVPGDWPTPAEPRKLSVDDFRTLHDNIRSLKYLGEQEKILTILGEQLDMALAVQEAVTNAAGLHRRPLELRASPPRDPLASINSWSYDPKTMLDTLDNRDPNGIFNRTLMIPGRAATVAEHTALFQTEDAIKTAINGAKGKDWARWNKQIAAGHGLMHPLYPDKEMLLTHGDIMSIASQYGNELNKWHLFEGGWGFDPVKVEALLAQLPAEDWHVLHTVAKAMEDSWPEVVKTEMKLTGLAPERVVPTPFTLPNGVTSSGFYWPLKRDDAINSRLQGAVKEDASLLAKHFYREGSTPKGHTVRRTQAKYVSQLNWMDTVRTHFPNIAKRNAYGEYAVNALKFLRQPEIGQLVAEVHGPNGMAVLRDFVERQLGYRSIDPRIPAVMDAIAHDTRMRAYSALAGFKVAIMLEHATSVAQSIGVLGLAHTAQGYLRWAADPVRVTQFALESSGYLRIRAGEVDLNMRDMLDDIDNQARTAVPGVRTPLDVPVGMLNKWSQALLSTVNNYGFAIQTWTGAYWAGRNGTAENIGRKLAAMSHDEAVNYADSVVAKSHGSGMEADMTRWQAGMGSEVVKLINMFNVFRGTVSSRVREYLYHTFHAQDNAERAAAMKGLLVFGLAVGAVGKMVADNGPKDVKSLLSWAAWVTETWIQSMARLVPIAENVFESGNDIVDGRNPNFQLSPTEGGMTDILKTVNDGVKTFKKGEMPEHTLRDAAYGLGMLLGAPLGQFGETGQTAKDMLTHSGYITRPVRGLLFGPSHENPSGTPTIAQMNHPRGHHHR